MSNTMEHSNDEHQAVKDSLHFALTDWLLQNFGGPVDSSTLIAFIIAAIFSWYVINWIVHFLMFILWPFATAAMVFLIVPYIREGNMREILPNIVEGLKHFIGKIGQVGQGGFERCLR